MIAREMILAVPKSDLHTHLDGSMRVSTLIELAREQGVALPSYEVEGLNEQVFKPVYRDLPEYLAGFRYTCAVLRSFEAMERAAFELAEDAAAQGVRYIEVRFAPQLLVPTGDACVRALKAVGYGLARAARRHNALPAVLQGEDIPFEWSIICCAMRNFTRGMGVYFDNLLDLLPGMAHKDLVSTASLEAVHAAVVARDRHGVPVMGFDLAGEEAGYPAGHHDAAYEEAHRHFLRKTVHAGEAYGPESIYAAIVRCHAERIGHGTFLFDADRVRGRGVEDKAAYTDALAEYIATMRITIEVCPTSNLQTIPSIESVANHPLKRMLDANLSVSICTDNRLMSRTSVTRELELVCQQLAVTPAKLRNIILAGFKGSFFGPYNEKRALVRQVSQRFDALEKQHLGSAAD